MCPEVIACLAWPDQLCSCTFWAQWATIQLLKLCCRGPGVMSNGCQWTGCMQDVGVSCRIVLSRWKKGANSGRALKAWPALFRLGILVRCWPDLHSWGSVQSKANGQLTCRTYSGRHCKHRYCWSQDGIRWKFYHGLRHVCPNILFFLEE